jgi:hypothetical protein
MKSKIEKSKKSIKSQSGQNQPDRTEQNKNLNEAYQQINKVSFQNNFKNLIGHYKTDIVASTL